MMLIRSRVKYSPIHGLGCFAEEDIKKGQIVWRFDPRLDLEFDANQLALLPSPVVEFLKTYSYGILKESKKILILCGDNARHMNHSDTPNLLETANGENIAAFDIQAGEELTCDYSQFDLDADNKLTSNR